MLGIVFILRAPETLYASGATSDHFAPMGLDTDVDHELKSLSFKAHRSHQGRFICGHHGCGCIIMPRNVS